MSNHRTFKPPSREGGAPAKPSPFAPRTTAPPATGAVQRTIRKSSGAEPYTTVEEVVADYPGEGGVPSPLARSILTTLLGSGTIDVNASEHGSWVRIAFAYENLVSVPSGGGGAVLAGKEEGKVAEKVAPSATTSTPSTASATTTVSSASTLPARSDLEFLLDENFLPVALQDTAPAAIVLKLKGWTASSWAAGKIFYSETAEEDSPIHPLPPETINAFWDNRYPSPFVRVGGPDWRANCADHAIGGTFEDVGAAKTHLASGYDNRGNYNSPESLLGILNGLGNGVYIAQVGMGNPHFIRLTLNGTNAALSQKDQESAVYEATMSKSEAATYIYKKSGTGIVYQGR